MFSQQIQLLKVTANIREICDCGQKGRGEGKKSVFHTWLISVMWSL